MMRIAVVANTAWYLFNFRLNLMLALQQAGHAVVAIAPEDGHAARLRQAGIPTECVAISGSGTHPLREAGTVLALRSALRRQRIDLVLSYTPKGNLYSALGCLTAGIAFVPNVSGLGRLFIRPSAATHVAKLLYRLTFHRAHHVFFQNNDDMALFLQQGLVEAPRCERLPGSGVDLQRFQASALPAARAADAPAFLLVARMLWDKGVGEYVAAARILKARHPAAQFRLLGFVDVANPSAIPRHQIEEWVQEGLVDYLGPTDDVRPFLVDADCIVLPSYREGVPRTLLEAAATGRPVITTDAPGCRDTVVDGTTGYLCRPADAHDLADKMDRFIALPAAERATLGRQARQFVAEHFDETLVLTRYLDVVNRLASRLSSGGS